MSGYTIRRCTICGHPIHIHQKEQGFVIRNKCGHISLLEIKDFDLVEINKDFHIMVTAEQDHVFSQTELDKFFETMGFNPEEENGLQI